LQQKKTKQKKKRKEKKKSNLFVQLKKRHGYSQTILEPTTVFQLSNNPAKSLNLLDFSKLNFTL